VNAANVFRPVPVPALEPPEEEAPEAIGKLLVASGQLSEAQLEQVLLEQRRRGGRFGEVAVRLRLVRQDAVDRALARHFGYPAVLDPAECRLPGKLVTALNPALPFAESVRALRSQLMLRWFDGTPGKSTLAIASVDRGDGKSFVLANLAVAFSQLGETTLLVDADMRHPVLHDMFGLENKAGLSALLSGRAGLEEVKTIPGLPMLSVLPSGARPPNPQELLGRNAFRILLNQMSSRFNVILLDTPAAQEASDALVVAQRAGGALVVARRNRTRSVEMSQLSASLAHSGVQVLGCTLNDY
jgi:protein-tyrosine kinase